ncbi:MAG: hypothetical protein P8X92_07470 [Dehalococcoidia bacterium]|jgi:hypothetical protein
MPISRDQFTKGIDNTAQRILNFLAEHPDNAYEPSEIAEAIDEGKLPGEKSLWRGMALLSLTWQNHSILDDLVKKGLVDRKIIKGVPWFCIHKD